MATNRWPTIEGEYEEELESELEGELEYEAELEGELESELETELEGELEGEWELEGQAFVNPLRRVYPDAERALMEHLGRAAMEAESEEEAEAFIGALVPLAAQLVPRVAPAIMRAAPQLIRGVGQVVSQLRQQPQTRRLVQAVPSIVARTAQSLGAQAQAGRPLTVGRAVKTLARQSQRVLQSPAQRRQALRRSRSLDRHYHRVVCA
jgi:hypothetical protein